MRYSTAIVVAAIGFGEAMAGPAHVHLHRRVHEKKDIDWSALDWDAMGINWSSAWAAGQAEKTAAAAAPSATEVQTTAAAAATTGAASPAAAAASNISGASAGDVVSDLVVNDKKMLFGGLVGYSNYLTAFGADSTDQTGSGIGAIGNVGSPYGSNIIRLAQGASHPFTATFVNTQSEGITVNCWNKAGQDGAANSGFALAPQQTTLTMYLPAGKSETVGFLSNSQGGCVEATNNIAESGGFATTWFEWNMATGGSGYDVSAIMNSNGNNYNMSISSVETPCVSNMNENMWLTPSEPVGTSDGSCYVPGDSATLTVIMGGVV